MSNILRPGWALAVLNKRDERLDLVSTMKRTGQSFSYLNIPHRGVVKTSEGVEGVRCGCYIGEDQRKCNKIHGNGTGCELTVCHVLFFMSL